MHILARIGFGKEPVERAVVYQVPDRCKLKFVQRDVRRIEVDGRDSDRRHGQIAQNIAATRRNSDQLFTFLKGQCFEIHERIFPDLRIDEPRKGEREQPLQDALLGNRLVAVHCLPQSFVLASTPLPSLIAVRDRLLD